MKSKILICFSAFILSACTTSAHLDSIQNYHASENYEKIVQENNSSNNLDLLIRADAQFHMGNFNKSDKLFEKINKKNINPTKTSLGAELGKLAGGQMATDYKPYMMDLLFTRYYQIWGALADKRFDDARVIINQSYDRQKKMSREYKNLISDKQESVKRNKITGTLSSSTSKWSTYSDIMNPALTYLSGLYFLNISETENARQYLTRAAGMMPNNKYIQSDLSLAENGKTPNNTAWIFFETGYAPRLQEQKINIPWMIGLDIQIISIATSVPKENTKFKKQPKLFELLANTDSMFMTEYKEYQINNAMRSFAKAISNSAIQSAAKQKMAGWGDLIGTVYSVATTRAEIRSWVTLPKHIYLLRIKKNKSGLIELSNGNTINVGYNGNDLIYIRNNDIKIIKIKK